MLWKYCHYMYSSQNLPTCIFVQCQKVRGMNAITSVVGRRSLVANVNKRTVTRSCRLYSFRVERAGTCQLHTIIQMDMSAFAL